MTQHPQGRIGGKMDEANKSAFPFYTLLPQKEEAAFDFKCWRYNISKVIVKSSEEYHLTNY